MQRYSCIISNGFQQISEWIKFNKISHKTISNSYLHESTLALHFLFASRAIACQRVAIAESKHWTKLICRRFYLGGGSELDFPRLSGRKPGFRFSLQQTGLLPSASMNGNSIRTDTGGVFSGSVVGILVFHHSLPVPSPPNHISTRWIS